MPNSQITSQKPNIQNHRIAFLDLLRFYSAIIVGISHLYDSNTVNEKVIFPLYNFQKDYWFFYSGYGGVVIFFLISGYIIPASMNRCKNFLDFIVKRIIRIYPLFIAVYLYSLWRFDNFNFSHLVALILPIADFFNVAFLFDPDWTLRVEFLYYIIIGIIFYKFKLSFKSLYFCFFITFLLIIFTNFFNIFMWNFKLRFMIFLFIGSLLFKIELQKFTNNKNVIYVLFLFLLAILIFEIFGFNYKYFFENVAIGSMIFLIFYLLQQTKFRIKSNKFTTFLGDLTYPCYLLHYLIYKDLYNFFNSHLITIIIFFIICFAAHILIEKPLQKFLTKKLI